MSSAKADAKLFTRNKVGELRADLASEKKDKNWTRTKTTLKKIIANATMGNDMSALFPEVVRCMSIQVLEIKKMVCEYMHPLSSAYTQLLTSCLNCMIMPPGPSRPLPCQLRPSPA